MQNETIEIVKHLKKCLYSADFLIGYASAVLLSIVIVLIIKLLIKHNQIFLTALLVGVCVTISSCVIVDRVIKYIKLYKDIKTAQQIRSTKTIAFIGSDSEYLVFQEQIKPTKMKPIKLEIQNIEKFLNYDGLVIDYDTLKENKNILRTIGRTGTRKWNSLTPEIQTKKIHFSDNEAFRICIADDVKEGNDAGAQRLLTLQTIAANNKAQYPQYIYELYRRVNNGDSNKYTYALGVFRF